MTYSNLVFFAILAVFLCDLSGFSDTLKTALGRWLGKDIKRLPPFDCSLCVAWWLQLGYLIFAREFSIANLAVISLISFATYPLGQLLILMRETLLALIRLTQKLIDKL